MSARVVGFVSEKGGTGKTTACYHIGAALTRYHDKDVLVVDADYQRGGVTGRFFPHLIENFGSGAMPGTTLFHKFQQLYSAGERSPEVDIANSEEEIDVIVADPRLSTVTVDKLPSSNNIRANSLELLKHLQVIDYVLSPLKEQYDYILIDSHPEVSDVLRSIIYACDYCVSPVKLDRQSSIGVATVIGEINNVNADLEMITGIVEDDLGFTDTIFAGSMGMMAREYDESLKNSEQIEYNRLRRTGGVFKNYITEGDGLRLAAANRRPVYDESIANAIKQSDQFKQLTQEFIAACP